MLFSDAGSLCYTPCKAGYSSDSGSVTTCSAHCDSGFRPSGVATCFRAADSYSKSCLKKGCKDGYKDTGCTCFAPAATRNRHHYNR